MFLKEKYTNKRHASHTRVFENADFVFFAYLKRKLNTAGSFRVFTLYIIRFGFRKQTNFSFICTMP